MMRTMVLALVLLCSSRLVWGETVAGCDKTADLRQRAFCLLKTDDEAAIARLHAVAVEVYGKELTRSKHQDSAMRETYYAAENAGVVAGKTSEAQLYKLLGQEKPVSQVFALRGLSHMLSILRMGYAKGGTADETRLNAVMPKVAAACIRKLKSKHDAVIEEAAGCLGETRSNQHAPLLVNLVVSTSSATVQSRAFEALRGLEQLSEQARALRPLAKVLLRPLPKKWTSDDATIRAGICGLLSMYANHGDTWAQKPAETAIKEIGDRNSEVIQKCKRLLNRI